MAVKYSQLANDETPDVEKDVQIDCEQNEDETEDSSSVSLHSDEDAPFLLSGKYDKPRISTTFASLRTHYHLMVGIVIIALAVCMPAQRLLFPPHSDASDSVSPQSPSLPTQTSFERQEVPGEDDMTPSKPAWLDFEMTPYTGPPSLQETVDQCAQQPGLCYSYICRGSGIGGQTMTFLTDMVYMQKKYNRTRFILDESGYRKYETKDHAGLMLAYFTPRMAVLEHKEDVSSLNRLMPANKTYGQWRNINRDILYSPDSHLAVARHPGQHNNLLRFYSDQNGHRWKDLYQDSVAIACPNMQFNDQTWSRISTLRHDFDFPNYLELPSTAPVLNLTTGVNETMSVGSISFHIRRTDKIYTGKSKLYRASEYLDHARRIEERDQIKLTHCFVATDEYSVISEIRRDLKSHPEDSSLCRYLHYTPLDGRGVKRDGEDGALIFLSEISVLKETTYFVGTFNSNVGDLVALLRACPNLPHDATKHFAESYGVDEYDWYYDPGTLGDHGP